MNLSDLVPKHRIEIRRAGSAPHTPWEIAELAHTENHVTAKLPFWKNNRDLETRVCPNLPAAPQPLRIAPAPSILAPEKPLPASMKTPLTTPPAIVATGPAANPPIPATSPVLATTAASPELPFKVGDRLQDKLVPNHPPLYVLEINPDGRPGFSWTCPDNPNPSDKKGFCPVGSVGCFEKYSESAAGRAFDRTDPAGGSASDPDTGSAAGNTAAHSEKKPRTRAARKAAPHKTAAAHKPARAAKHAAPGKRKR